MVTAVATYRAVCMCACCTVVWRSPDALTCLHFVDDVIGRQEEGLVDTSTVVVQRPQNLGGVINAN